MNSVYQIYTPSPPLPRAPRPLLLHQAHLPLAQGQPCSIALLALSCVIDVPLSWVILIRVPYAVISPIFQKEKKTLYLHFCLVCPISLFSPPKNSSGSN